MWCQISLDSKKAWNSKAQGSKTTYKSTIYMYIYISFNLPESSFTPAPQIDPNGFCRSRSYPKTEDNSDSKEAEENICWWIDFTFKCALKQHVFKNCNNTPFGNQHRPWKKRLVKLWKGVSFQVWTLLVSMLSLSGAMRIHTLTI